LNSGRRPVLGAKDLYLRSIWPMALLEGGKRLWIFGRGEGLIATCGRRSDKKQSAEMAEEAIRAAGAAQAAPAVSEEQLRKAEGYIEAEEGVVNRLAGWAGTIVTTIAVVMTLFHLYAAYDIVPTQPLRYTHVAFVMVLCFLMMPLAVRFRDRIRWWGGAAGGGSGGVPLFALLGGGGVPRPAPPPPRPGAARGALCHRAL